MNTTLDYFIEAIENGYLYMDGEVTVSRRNGKVFDYVLPDEVVTKNDTLSVENLADVMKELKTY